MDATKTHNLILNALLGGAENENDHADLLLEGLNTNGEITVLIPVNGPRAAERNNTTQLLAFKREATLPAGTVSLRFKVTFLRESGTWNEAFVDNLDVRVKLD